MANPIPWLAYGSLLAGAASIWFVRFLWPYRDKPGARFFIGTICAEAVWCLAYGAALFVHEESLRFLFEIPIWAGINFIGVFFLAFALEYTGRGELVRSRWMRGLVALQVVHTLLVATNPIHNVAWSQYTVAPTGGVATVTYTHEPWLFVNATGVIVTIAAASFLLVDTFFSYGRLYRTQTAAVALSPAFPGIAFLLWLFQVGDTWQMHLTPLTFPIHLAFDFYAFFSRNMFERTPAARRVGERAAIDDLGTAVVIVDDEDLLIDVNRAAESVLDVGSDVLGDPLDRHLPAVDPREPEQTVTIASEDGRRTYAVSTSAIEDAAGRRVGATIVLQDITRERLREQRLSVLNRVLRHNLRNDLNVVRGNVEVAQERVSDPALSSALGTAAAKTEDVIDLGEKARDIERAIGSESDRSGPVNLATLLGELKAELSSAYPEGRIEIDVPPEITITGDQLLIDRVFRNLLENGVEHDDGPEPTVTVSVLGVSDGRGTVEIRDQGPGLPDHERAVLETGEETPLQHGSGLGLWLVKWGIEALGGEIRFEVDEAGTRAIVELPNVEPSE